MINVIEQTDKLIDVLKETEFVEKMYNLKNEIIQKKLINSTDIRSLYKNPIIHEYVENQNILDMHIYYLNSKIKGLINESN